MDYLRNNTNEFLGLPTKHREMFNRVEDRERRMDNRDWMNRDFNREWFNRDFNRMNEFNMPWMNTMNFDRFNRFENMWNTRCEHGIFWRECNRCFEMFREHCLRMNRDMWNTRCEHNTFWRECNRCLDRFDFNLRGEWMRMDRMPMTHWNRDMNMNRFDNNMWNRRCEHDMMWRDCNHCINRSDNMWNTRCEHNLFWRDCNRCDMTRDRRNTWDNRWFNNHMLCNTSFRPSSEAEYSTLRNPIRSYDRETRGLWLCFDLRGFKPEEVKCTFDRKERCITIEACHEVKDVKEHTVVRKFFRKFCLPEYMKTVDLSKMELRCFFGPDCFFYIEGVLPHMNFESWPMPCEMPFFGGWDWMRNWDCREHRDNRECWDSNRCFRRIECKYI